MDDTNNFTCERCGKIISIEETFTLTHAGPKYSLVTYCEPCCDIALLEYQKEFIHNAKRS